MSRMKLGSANKKGKTGDRPSPTPQNNANAEHETAENGEDKRSNTHKGAKKALRQAVKAQIKIKSSEIARKLVDKAAEGDMQGTAIMLSLMDKTQAGSDQKKRKKRSEPSWAELLASEPEWDESIERDGAMEKPH